MPSRIDEALTRLRGELAGVEIVTRTASDGDWVKPGAAEAWPVGFVAFHIARGFQRQAEFVEEAVAGRGPHRFDWGDTHALNASIVAAHPSPSRDEVVALGRKSVERMAAAVAGRAAAPPQKGAPPYPGPHPA